MPRKDDFKAAVKREVALRAGHICSHPECMEHTSLPHSDPSRSVITGKACHIKAASPLGPRYDAKQTSEERRSILNAIWLCSICSDKVDKDWRPLQASVLQQWKIDHEHWIEGRDILRKVASKPSAIERLIPAVKDSNWRAHQLDRVDGTAFQLSVKFNESKECLDITAFDAFGYLISMSYWIP